MSSRSQICGAASSSATQVTGVNAVSGL